MRREQLLRVRGTNGMAGRDGSGALRFRPCAYTKKCCTSRSRPVGAARLHRQIGEREEQAYGERAREIAAELAVHFERGRDYQRAVQYLQQAGENAMQRCAHQEATAHFTKGLELLKTLPDTPWSTHWSVKNPWTRRSAARSCWPWVKHNGRRASTLRPRKRCCTLPTLPGRWGQQRALSVPRWSSQG